jgi:hypothetical protein
MNEGLEDADKGRIEDGFTASIPLGLKPDIDLIGLGGATKVVPCYKASVLRVFPQPV